MDAGPDFQKNAGRRGCCGLKCSGVFRNAAVSALGPVDDLVDGINCDKCIFVRFHDIGHQQGILIFVNDGDDLFFRLVIVGADGFIDGGSAVELV